MKIEGTNDNLMVTAAHRYCLGRRSYIVGSCIEWLRAIWKQMEPGTQSVILRDTAEALMDGRAGMDYDVRDWKQLLAWGMTQATEAQREWVRQAVAWKEKPWPLRPEETGDEWTPLPAPDPNEKTLRTALEDAAALLGDIMRDEANAQDEAEKWMREYEPLQLRFTRREASANSSSTKETS